MPGAGTQKNVKNVSIIKFLIKDGKNNQQAVHRTHQFWPPDWRPITPGTEEVVQEDTAGLSVEEIDPLHVDDFPAHCNI